MTSAAVTHSGQTAGAAGKVFAPPVDASLVVTAAANLTDEALVRGNGGALGVQTSLAILSDVGALSGLTKLTVDNLELDGNDIKPTGNLNLRIGANALNTFVTGVASGDKNALTYVNDIWNAAMVDTRTSLSFWQAYNVGGDVWGSGQITVGTETNWTAVGATQDSYMAFYTTLNAAVAEKVRITSTGHVGVNCDPLTHPGASVNDYLLLHRQGAGINMAAIVETSSAAGHRPLFYFRRARNTAMIPRKVENNDYLGSFVAAGHDGNAYRNVGGIEFVTDGATGVGVVPCAIWLRTGTLTRTTRMTIQSDGDILIDSGTAILIRDPQISLSSSVDGQLDIDADIKLDLTAPTVQLNASSSIQLVSTSIYAATLKSGVNQAGAGAAAGELYVDTDDDNTVKRGV